MSISRGPRIAGAAACLVALATVLTPATASAAATTSAPASQPTLVKQRIIWSPTVKSVAGSATSFTPSPLATTSPSNAGAITYARTGGTAACTVNPTTAVMTWTTPGSCVVTASAAATTVYSAASIAVTFTITPVAQATLLISNSTRTSPVGTPITLTTTGGSGTGSVSFAATGRGCSLSGSTLSATRLATCSVTATKAASGIYSSATSAAASFTFTTATQAPLVISNTVTTAPAGTPITLTTTGGSGTGAVTFAATGAGCSVSGNVLTASQPTTCSVVATKAASGAYGPTSSAPIAFTFTGVDQVVLTISNTNLTGFTGTPVTLTTTGGSGTGAVTFAATGTGCTVAANLLTATDPTTCTVVATKAASGIYGPTSSAPVDFTILFAGVPVPADMFGIHYAPQTIGQGTLTPRIVRLWDLGVAWRDVNPAKGVFNWAALDQRVAEVEAMGADPLLVLGLTPLWAASSQDGDPRWGAGSAAAPTDVADFRAYVSAVAERYEGRMAGYEVWNEANLLTFWTGTPEKMAELTQVANEAITAADPDALVVAASTTLRLGGRLTNWTEPYYRALMAMGWPFDAFAIHSYPNGQGTPVTRFDLVQNWKTRLANVSGTTVEGLGKTLIDSEINYGIAGPGTTIPGTDFDDATGAAYLARTYVDSLRLGISSTHWYLWTDGFFDIVGVQMNSTTPAVNTAYATVQSWLVGSKFRGCTVTGAVTECAFTRAGAALHPRLRRRRRDRLHAGNGHGDLHRRHLSAGRDCHQPGVRARQVLLGGTDGARRSSPSARVRAPSRLGFHSYFTRGNRSIPRSMPRRRQAPSPTASRTSGPASGDGPVWWGLTWQAIKSQYRRTYLGPWWITVQQVIFVAGLSLLFGFLLKQDLKTFVPYVTIGFIAFTWMTGMIPGGATSITNNGAAIKTAPGPLSIIRPEQLRRQHHPVRPRLDRHRRRCSSSSRCR